MFSSKAGESLNEIYERFNYLINDLKTHVTEYDNEDVLIKFLRSIPFQWDGVTVAIRQTRNLQAMTLQGLYGNLLTHDLELQQRKSHNKEAKNKYVALFSADENQSLATKSRHVQEEDSEEEDEEESGS